MPTRRQLLTAALALALPLFVPASVFAAKPSQRVRLGFIGVGRRGKQLLEAMSESAKVVARCDVFRPRAEPVGGKYDATVFTDFCYGARATTPFG